MATKTAPDFAIVRRLFLEARTYWPHIFGILLLDLLATPLALLAPLPLKVELGNSVVALRPEERTRITRARCRALIGL